jgi:hypothetical protein
VLTSQVYALLPVLATALQAETGPCPIPPRFGARRCVIREDMISNGPAPTSRLRPEVELRLALPQRCAAAAERLELLFAVGRFPGAQCCASQDSRTAGSGPRRSLHGPHTRDERGSDDIRQGANSAVHRDEHAGQRPARPRPGDDDLSQALIVVTTPKTKGYVAQNAQRKVFNPIRKAMDK